MTEYQEFEMDLHQIIEKVFSDKPQSPGIYQIIFDPSEIDPSSDYTQYVFEQLLIIFSEGSKIYFHQDQIDISQITPQDFYQLQLYFHSMGFRVDCQIEKILDETKIQNFLNTSSNLEDLPPLTLNNTSPDSTNPSQHKQETISIHQSASGQSLIETTGENLKDYHYIINKDNNRYIISFDYFSNNNTYH